MLPVIIVSLSLLLTVSGQTTSGPVACNAQIFYQCQQAFEGALQVPPGQNADWHNPTALALVLQNIFANGLPGWGNALVGVCNAYNGLINCLGPMAPSCLHLQYLLGNDNTPNNAYGYLSVMNGLSFDCGAGFYPGVYNWDCISRVYKNYNATLFNCISTFILHFGEDPDNACDYLQTALNCVTAPYQGLCNVGSGGAWYGCETWRVYFATRLYNCPAQCSVNKRAIESEDAGKHPEGKDAQPHGA